VIAPIGPLGFLRDRGDRLVATRALLANIPAVLTFDQRTFWAHRAALAEFGLQVVRPAELLALYEPYWAALELEFARRRADAGCCVSPPRLITVVSWAGYAAGAPDPSSIAGRVMSGMTCDAAAPPGPRGLVRVRRPRAVVSD